MITLQGGQNIDTNSKTINIQKLLSEFEFRDTYSMCVKYQ